jgi:hypothetical protein
MSGIWSPYRATHAIYSQVTLEEATTKSQEMNVMFMETSAKAGHNVKSLFKKIAMSLPGMESQADKDAANTSTFVLRRCRGTSSSCEYSRLVRRNRCHDDQSCRGSRSFPMSMLAMLDISLHGPTSHCFAFRLPLNVGHCTYVALCHAFHCEGGVPFQTVTDWRQRVWMADLEPSWRSCVWRQEETELGSGDVDPGGFPSTAPTKS